MLTKAIEVQRYIRASAGRAGIRVVFEHTNQPRHDGKTIFLPQITPSTTVDDLKQLMASIDHEVAHDRFSCFKTLQEVKVEPNSLPMLVWNILEDSRVNNIEAREYRGFRENWDECASTLVDKILDKAIGDPSPIANLISSMITWECGASAQAFPLTELAANKYPPKDAKTMDVLSNFSDRLLECHLIEDKVAGSMSTYKLSEDILKELADKHPKMVEEICKAAKPKPKGKEKSDKAGKGKEADKGKKEGTKEEGTAAAEATETGEGGEGDTEDDEYKILHIVVSEKDMESYTLTKPEDGKEMGKVGINHDPISLGYKGVEWDLTDYKDFVVVDYPKSISPKEDFLYKRPVFVSEYKGRLGGKVVAQENFAQQVRRLIQIRAKVQTQYGVKRGKLDQSRLSRICFDAPGFNEKVFKRKIENKTLDAAVTVLVDMSGSMMGDKCFFAVAATQLLNEVCTTIGIPLEILGFTDGYSPTGALPVAVPYMFIYKGFSDLHVSNDLLLESFASSSPSMNGNPDGENILWAHDRLIKRKEKKKILLVMSDGQPAASKSSVGVEDFTHKVIGEIEKGGVVDIYGLGLCSDSVTHYYKAHGVVKKPEDIPTTLLTLIEKRILG